MADLGSGCEGGPDVVGYVARVAAVLGVAPDSFSVELGDPSTAYLALAERLPDWPDHDVALLWHERTGWSVAIEINRGLAFVTLDRLRSSPSPPPSSVAVFASHPAATRCSSRLLLLPTQRVSSVLRRVIL